MKNKQLKKLISSCLVIVVFVMPLGGIQAKDFDDSVSTGNNYPAWFKETLFYDLEENMQEAKSNGKKGMMIVFGTSGCSYCEEFIKKSLGNQELTSLVKTNFDSIAMEIFDDAEMVSPKGKSMSIKQFAKQEGVQFSPTLLFYDTDGRRVLKVTGYQSPERFKHILDFVTGKHYRIESLRDHFKHATKTANNTISNYQLKSDSLFSKPPYMLQRGHIKAQQPLLVLFEKESCAECQDFHEEVLTSKEVRKTLGEFEVVQINSTDNKTVIRAPNGRRTTPAKWFKRLEFSRLPALVLFNENGEKVLETDALVKRQRMMNSLNFVLERAYEKDWTYQRFARAKGIERNMKKTASKN